MYSVDVIPITYPFMINYFVPGYPASKANDIYGYLCRIWKLYISGYHSRIHEWYAGYPFLRFYPPLSYFLACRFSKLPGLDYIVGVKLVMAFSLIIATVTMRLP